MNQPNCSSTTRVASRMASTGRTSARSSSSSSKHPWTRRTHSGRFNKALAPWRRAQSVGAITFRTWNARALLCQDPLKRKKKVNHMLQ
eukprot:2041001-Pyramimonas_sp.AAC.1